MPTDKTPTNPRSKLLGGALLLFVGLFIAAFIFVCGSMLLPLVAPETAGNLGSRTVKAADVACRKGCEDSPNDMCYSSCMASSTTPNSGD